MADHVAVGVVADDGVVLSGLDRRDELVGNLRCAHLRLEVVGGHVGRRHENAVFARIDVLDSAVEEVRDVRVFLGFGDAQLLSSQARNVFAKAVADRLRRERDGKLREFLAIGREAHVSPELRHPGAGERAEGGVGQRTRDLARAVGAEVHEHDDITVGHRRVPSVAIRDCRGLDEFVIFAARVGGVQCGLRRGGRIGRATVDQQIVGRRDAVPALVAVHRVIAPDDRRHARARMLCADAFQERQRLGGAARWRVAPVEEGMDEDSRDTRGGGHVDECRDLPFVAVDAAGRGEAQHVQRRIIALRHGHRVAEHGIAREFAGRDRVVDAREVLIDHAARPDVEVADLRVAHLAFGQSDMQFGRVDRRMRRRGQQVVPVGHRSAADRVVRRCLATAESVQDQQHDGPRAKLRRRAFCRRRGFDGDRGHRCRRGMRRCQ